MTQLSIPTVWLVVWYFLPLFGHSLGTRNSRAQMFWQSMNGVGCSIEGRKDYYRDLCFNLVGMVISSWPSSLLGLVDPGIQTPCVCHYPFLIRSSRHFPAWFVCILYESCVTWAHYFMSLFILLSEFFNQIVC